MYRSHTCGELRISDVNKQVTLAGWVQRSRKMGGMTFVDLRDRYGITQLVFNEEVDAELCEQANRLGREFVIQIVGTFQQKQKYSYGRYRNHRIGIECAEFSLNSSFYN